MPNGRTHPIGGHVLGKGMSYRMTYPTGGQVRHKNMRTSYEMHVLWVDTLYEMTCFMEEHVLWVHMSYRGTCLWDYS